LWIQAPPKALVAESCGRVTDAWFCNGKWWICDDLGDEFGRSEVHNATHWMPIPEPPKDYLKGTGGANNPVCLFMALVSDEDMSRVLEILSDETGAAHRAAHEFLDDLTKTVLAELMNEADAKSATEREQWARSQPRFREHLEKVGKFAKLDYTWRQRYAAANAKADIWRTQSANARNADRVR